MADFAYCVQQAIDSGKITKAVGKEILEAENPDAAITNLAANLTRQKREAAIQAVRLAEAWANIKGHPGGLYDGLVSLLTKDPTGKAPYTNVEYEGRVISGRFDAKMAELMSRFRTRRIGFEQDEEGLRKLVRAIYGEAVDDSEIEGFAKGWKDLTEEVRQEFNKQGGSISKNESWLMPQNHDMRAIENVGRDTWKKRIMPLLDRSKMTDDFGEALTDQQFDEALDYVYDTITSGGLNKAKDFASRPQLGKKLSRKGSERRFLYFKDADSWLEYQKDFGKGDIFTTLTDWIDSKANDIALMKVLGPNPNTTFDALKTQVNKTKKLSNRQEAMSNSIFNVATGKTSDGNLTGLADFMQSTRNLLTASTLGSAFLSSVSDAGTSAITAKYNGIGAVKVLSRQMSLMNPKNEADRVLAVRMGLIAEAWKGRAHGSNRYADVYGTGATAKIAEGVMRASLLSPWTDAGRKAFGMEFAGMLVDNFGKSIEELDNAVLRAFKTYGIEKSDWDQFRKTKPLVSDGGAKFADLTQEGGDKFQRMILTEMDYAVPTPDARVKAITTGGTGRQTVGGQLIRSITMLKSFPITIAATHFYRAAYQSTLGGKLAYIGTFVASASILGGAALQLKDIAAGREPRPVDGKFISASIMQGGGLGIFGDLLFSDVNRFGGGIASSAIGPTGELIDKTVALTLGNIQQAFLGEETNVLGETATYLKRYTPDTWQTRLFTDAVFDQLAIMADPEMERRLNRIVRKRQKEFDQGYWWRPGEPLPEALQ